MNLSALKLLTQRKFSTSCLALVNFAYSAGKFCIPPRSLIMHPSSSQRTLPEIALNPCRYSNLNAYRFRQAGQGNPDLGNGGSFRRVGYHLREDEEATATSVLEVELAHGAFWQICEIKVVTSHTVCELRARSQGYRLEVS